MSSYKPSLIRFSTEDFPTGHMDLEVQFLNSICQTCHEDKALIPSPAPCVCAPEKKKKKKKY